MTEPTPAQLQAAFQLASIDSTSLTEWATVLRCSSADGIDAVVKVTATKPGRADAMAAWTSTLAAAGLPVVAPLDLGVQNPQQVGDAWWVVYPFIDGRPYAGGADDAAAAGDLLGRIHAAEVPEAVLSSMRQYEYTDADFDDSHADLVTLQEQLPNYVDDAQPLLDGVEALLHRWWNTALPALRAADEAKPLPRAGLSSDYRSTNIVYRDGGFVLVDPDNGGVEPRLYELAMAVVLFHREAATAPGRMFTQAEWEAFFGAYSKHVTLTERERALWPHALDHMLWEEGTWALEDTDAAGWANERERGYLSELAVVWPERFPLP